MATFHQMSCSYRDDIDVIFEQAKKSTSICSNAKNFRCNQQNHTVSFELPPRGVTNGEKIDITLTSVNGITIVTVRSESLIKEFDCGNNRLNVKMIFDTINKKFQACTNVGGRENPQNKKEYQEWYLKKYGRLPAEVK